MMRKISIVGAGLAGTEAAYQLAKRGLPVLLIDMKPGKLSPAHENKNFAELVCSNSLRSEKLNTGSGLLKLELKHFDSLIMQAAEACRIPAGNALAVDRHAFAAYLSERLRAMPNISIVEKEITDLEELGEGYQIIAAGPLCSSKLFYSIKEFCSAENLYFFDAAAPLIEDESINKQLVYLKNRYEDGEGDYLNCAMNKEEYLRFYEALLSAEKAEVADFERDLLFEGCKPVEEIAADGEDSLRFGPLKPVGLRHPQSGEEAYAVVQLRQDDFSRKLWNMVGFQTRLKFPEQKRVFSMIPGLENARFARYGVMHRNSFICSPRVLGEFYQSKTMPQRYFAGQISGVEGYLESTASGLVAALSIANELLGSENMEVFRGRKNIMGGLQAYVAQSSEYNFQPMKANFSLLQELSKEEISLYRRKYQLKLKGRALRRSIHAYRSLESLNYSPQEILNLVDSQSNEDY